MERVRRLAAELRQKNAAFSIARPEHITDLNSDIIRIAADLEAHLDEVAARKILSREDVANALEAIRLELTDLIDPGNERSQRRCLTLVDKISSLNDH